MRLPWSLRGLVCCIILTGLTGLSGVAMAQTATKDWKAIEEVQALYLDNVKSDQANASLLTGQLALLQMQLEDFIRQYPRDKRVWQARLALPEIRCKSSLGLEQTVDWSAAITELEAILADPNLPGKLQADAEFAWITLVRTQGAAEGLRPEVKDKLWQHMEEFGVKYARHRMAGNVQFDLGMMLVDTDPVRAGRLFKFAAGNADEWQAAKAEVELAVLPYRSKPLDLEFVALDGRKVSVAALRGKVVLIDFWATWCGPCRRELPAVSNVYQRYHDQGFEIIGISLDEDEGELKRFLEERGMVWPQYFDGRGWETRVSRRFAITSIPRMWLLDQEGRIISTEIWSGNLEYHVKAQLAK